MKFNGILVSISVMVASVSSQARANCLNDFRANFDSLSAYPEKESAVRALNGKDIECLFRQAKLEANAPGSRKISLNDIYNDDSRENRVEPFFGKSSLPVFNTFEKHFFYIEDGNSKKLFGYNYSPSMQWLGGPGFLALTESPDGKYLAGDYTLDFVNQIPVDQFLAKNGRKVSRVRNNTHNLVYGNMLDQFYSINPDVFVNEGVKPRPDGTFKHVVYFILLRKQATQ